MHQLGNKSPRSSFRKALLMEKKTNSRSDAELPPLEPEVPKPQSFIRRTQETERNLHRSAFNWTDAQKKSLETQSLSMGQKQYQTSTELDYDFDTSALDQLVQSLDQFDMKYRQQNNEHEEDQNPTEKVPRKNESSEEESNEGYQENPTPKARVPPSLNTKFFTLHLPYDVLSPTDMLQQIIESICKTRGVNSSDLQALDRYGNLIDFDTQLQNVVGSEVILTKL